MVDQNLLSYQEVKEIAGNCMGFKTVELTNEDYEKLAQSKDSLQLIIKLIFESSVNEFLAEACELALSKSK
ncbi:MAG: hypothetical protein COA47_10255 [Robiginitomaculum sp.]|nr:MAG: hypothetical protein COA47_10255 [Robiginitomaculum sp.]